MTTVAMYRSKFRGTKEKVMDIYKYNRWQRSLGIIIYTIVSLSGLKRYIQQNDVYSIKVY